MKTTPTKGSLEQFNYFAECKDEKRLPAILHDDQGLTAAECFHCHETYGKLLPCREPELLSRALNGKEWHGLTVTMVAEDFVGRIAFAEDIQNNYPKWVQRDIFGRAKQVAMKVLGFIPKFVQVSDDFSTITTENIQARVCALPA